MDLDNTLSADGLTPMETTRDIAVFWELILLTTILRCHQYGCVRSTGARPTKHISIEFEIRWKFQNAQVSNISDESQRYFAHVTTVTLSWRVQNIFVIGRVYFTVECFEFSSNFEFDRNMLSGTGARSHKRAQVDHLIRVGILIISGVNRLDRN